MKVIAIGGVAASMSAVSKLKRINNEIEVTVYEKGDVLSYGACGMPYYVSDEIKNASDLVARTKEDFKKRGITVHVNHEVIGIDEKSKTITIKDLKTNEQIIDTYDKLIIGTGAKPIIPKWEGVELNNIHTMTEYYDSIEVKEKMQSGKIKNVVVIGGGFIGIEMVEAFHKYDVNIKLIQLEKQILSAFDSDMTVFLESHLKENGIDMHLDEKVVSFKGKQAVSKVITNKGTYDADLVLISIGVIPNTDFLNETSIKRTKNGACLVNRYMETSVKDIYAGGDCATIYNRQLDIQQYIPMGNNANKQGKLIAENISGKNIPIDGVLGTIVIKVLNMEAAKTGITERYAIENHIKHQVVSVKGNNHAGYYPNPEKIHVKIIYNPDTKQILGAQLVGKKDTALRINPFVVAISKGMTTIEFGMLDLAYAPPFAGVWDITAIAANNAK